MKPFLIAALLHVLLVISSKAQYIINYSIKNGLSSYNVKGLLQDKYGFIWVGTQDGLNRFDGKEFEVFDKLAPPDKRLLNNHVKSMIIRGDSIWVSTALGGVNVIDIRLNKVVDVISPITEKGMSAWIENMQFDATGKNLWMSGFDGLHKYNTSTRQIRSWMKFPFLNSTGIVCRRFLFLDKKHLLLHIEGFGLAVFNTSTEILEKSYPFSTFNIPDKGHLIVNSMILVDKRIFVGSTHGVFAFEKNSNGVLNKIKLRGFTEVATKEIKDLLFSENKIYVSSSNGLYVYNEFGTLINKIDQTNSLISDEQISGCLIDKSNNLWLSSYSGLHLQNKIDIPYILNKEFKNGELKDITTIGSVNQDSLLLCTWNGLFFFNNRSGSFQKIKYRGQPTYGFYYNLLPLGNGEFIVSSQSGNYLLTKRDGSYLLVDSAESRLRWPIPKSFIFSSYLKINNESWLFGAEFEDGIIWYSGGERTMLNTSSTPLRISENSVNKLFLSQNSQIWILYDNSIDILDQHNKTIKNIQLGELPQAPDENIFFGIAEANGKMWIGTYGGGLLIVDEETKKWKKITTEDGLCNNSIYTIIKENEDYIWASTNIGLSRISTKNLEINNFFSKNSYLAFAFDERASLKMDSSIFFGGPNGLIEIFPDKLKHDLNRPDVYIKSISFSDGAKKISNTDVEIQKIDVPYYSPYLEMDLACINFNSPELNTFYYRLNKSSYWVNLGTNNKIRLPNFEPGRYLIEIRAASKNGLYSQSKFLSVKVRPPWYQTWWFNLLIFLTTTGLIYTFYRYRIQQIKKQHEIRKNIATDLHDDLGSTLNSVKVFTNLAISGIKQEESLQQVKDNLTEATMSLRDMIWVLDDSLDTVDELITRIKQFVIPVAVASNIEAIIKADSEVNSRKLLKEEKRNLFLICKEAINNSIKYSGATQIHVDITASGKKIQIAIADNGKGFSVHEVKKGYGLKNMQYRAEQIKYQVVLVSAPENGTEITIKPV